MGTLQTCITVNKLMQFAIIKRPKILTKLSRTSVLQIAMAGVAPALIYRLASLHMYIMNKDKVKIIRVVLMLTGTIEAYM